MPLSDRPPGISAGDAGWYIILDQSYYIRSYRECARSCYVVLQSIGVETSGGLHSRGGRGVVDERRHGRGDRPATPWSASAAEDRTPEKSRPRKSSWMFSGVFQWISSGIFQRNLTFQWYFPQDCQLSGGCLLEMSYGISLVFSDEM